MAKIANKGIFILLMGLILTLLTTALWAAPKLISGSIDAQNKQTKIVLQTNEKLEYRYFTLTQPDRLVIDMKGILQNDALLDMAKKVNKNDYFVNKIRLGQQNAQTVRMVFDLKRPVLAKINANNNNLIVQLTEKQTSKNTENNTQTESASLWEHYQQLKKDNTKDKTAQKNKKDKKRQIIVMLDPGHGGTDPGAVGQRNTYEKHVALQFAKTIQSKLEQKGYKVYLTHNGDIKGKLLLTPRRVKAHKVNADAFVSIHANSIENNSKVRGSSVLIWSLNANNKLAKDLAESENGQEKNVDISGVPEHIENKNARQIYTSMQDEYNSAESARLGNNILKRIAKHNIILNKNKTVDLANVAVLRSLDMPSVLIELAFLSNLEDEKLLNSSTFREKMSDSIVNGIDAYFKDPKTILK